VTSASLPPERKERESPAQAGSLSGRERRAFGRATRGRSARLPAEARHGHTLETSLGCITSVQLRGHRGQSRHHDAGHRLAGLLGHGDLGRDTRRANPSGPAGLTTAATRLIMPAVGRGGIMDLARKSSYRTGLFCCFADHNIWPPPRVATDLLGRGRDSDVAAHGGAPAFPARQHGSHITDR
jgi:hypothetical protein